MLIMELSNINSIKGVVVCQKRKVQKKFGRGLAWPSVVRNSQWEHSEGEQKIRESIFVILSTPLGSRYHQPDFGSMLPLLVFANYDEATAKNVVMRYIRVRVHIGFNIGQIG